MEPQIRRYLPIVRAKILTSGKGKTIPKTTNRIKVRRNLKKTWRKESTLSLNLKHQKTSWIKDKKIGRGKISPVYCKK